MRQNLALVLGLQGKYAEATKVGSVDLASTDAEANTALLKKMVKLDAKSTPQTAPAFAPSEPPAMATWAPTVAEAPIPKDPVAKSEPASGPALRKSTIETGFGGADDSRAAGLFSAD